GLERACTRDRPGPAIPRPPGHAIPRPPRPRDPRPPRPRDPATAPAPRSRDRPGPAIDRSRGVWTRLTTLGSAQPAGSVNRLPAGSAIPPAHVLAADRRLHRVRPPCRPDRLVDRELGPGQRRQLRRSSLIRLCFPALRARRPWPTLGTARRRPLGDPVHP